MEQAVDDEQSITEVGTTVTVTPHASEGAWIGEVVGMDALGEAVARMIESPPGYVYVRCADPLCATGLVSGRVYLVLARFVGPSSC